MAQVEVGPVTDGVVTLTLNRPEKRNALTSVMAAELVKALDAVAGARAVVITGDRRAFSAGGDVSEVLDEDNDVPGRGWFEANDALAAVGVVTVAAIEGFCLGGGLELALCCDLRVASTTALLGTPELHHGIFPAGGGTQRLPRVVGLARAKELMLLGAPIDVDTAAAWGLVNRIVPAGEALEHATALAGQFVDKAPAAVGAIKRLSELAFDVPLAEGLAAERAALAEL